MKIHAQSKMFVILWSLLLTGCAIEANNSSYDYSASIECLAEPLAPQYGGGTVENPNFDSGLNGWSAFGAGKIEPRKSYMGNNYLVAYNRTIQIDGFSQLINIQKDILYTFSAWLQLSQGNEIVSAFVELPGGQNVIVGSVIAKSGCWSMLKGGFQLDQNTKAQLYFSCNNTRVELWLDNVSLKPFTKIEWQHQRNKTIQQLRKRDIRIHVTSREGHNLEGAHITIDQTRPYFLLGCSTTETIINTTAYQNWFTSRFPVTSFNNEMKWYYTEVHPGQINYTVPDAMVSFFKKNRISIRGHNIVWDKINDNPSWVRSLPPRDVLRVAVQHTKSVVSRYSSDVIAWDVMNENMHFSFYEDKLGPNASAMFYKIVRNLDPNTPLFLNEFNTLEVPTDMKVIPSKYVEKLREIRSFPGNEDMVVRIGLQGHFLHRPNMSHTRASLDVLGATKMPIWLTELDTKRGPAQAAELEELIREAFSHPAVEGIIVWAGWKPTICSQKCLTDPNYDVLPKGCAQMCLTDNDFNNLPAGDVVDKLIKEWKTANVSGVTDKDGVFEQNVFLGEYSLTYSHPLSSKPMQTIFNVTSGKGPLELSVSF